MVIPESQRAGTSGLAVTTGASTTSGRSEADVHMADDLGYEPSEPSSHDPAAALLDAISQPSKKRRQSIDCKAVQQTKKVKLDKAHLPGLAAQSLAKDRAKQLPEQIWQHIFTLVPPRDLGRLLTVNKLFHAFLSPLSTHSPVCYNDIPSTFPILKPDAIWQASRRLFWPRMPAPLKGKLEIQMWRLVCSMSCQLCGFQSQKKLPSSNNEAWCRGPGPSDVCPIFPFCVFACGNCLKKKGIKVGVSGFSPDAILTSAIGTRSSLVFFISICSAPSSSSSACGCRYACYTSPCHTSRDCAATHPGYQALLVGAC